MLLQNDSKLNPILRRYGCYFLSLGRIIELETNYAFTAEDLLNIWFENRRNGAINNSFEILHPDRILSQFAKYTPIPHLVIAQIGEEKAGKVVLWNWAKSYKTWEYEIEMVKTFGDQGTHFRLCNDNKKVIFDSYSFVDYKHEYAGRYLLYKKL